jgi:hypothetical protein
MSVPAVVKEDKRAWTSQELKEYLAEVERLKSLWPPMKDPTTTENQRRSIENDKRRRALLRRFELENRNLEWPKSSPFEIIIIIIRPAADYWKNGCPYCDYKPKTTYDYEVHIVQNHPNMPAYPGPADIKKYGLNPL